MKDKDLYAVLDVDPYATQEEIKEAWVTQLKFFHPDRFQDDEKQKRNAEERTKEVNEAYGVLSRPRKRAKYDAENQVAKPEPFVKPAVIRFKNADAGEKKEATFEVGNKGGKYERIRIQSSAPWIEVVDYSSTGSNELPMRVVIEASCNDWDKSHEAHIIVKLDEEETQVNVKLQTKQKPVIPKEPVKAAVKTNNAKQNSVIVEFFEFIADFSPFLDWGEAIFGIISAVVCMAAIGGFVYYCCYIVPHFQFSVTAWSFLVHLIRDVGLMIIIAIALGSLIASFWIEVFDAGVFTTLMTIAIIIATIFSIVLWSSGFNSKKMKAVVNIPQVSIKVSTEVVDYFGSDSNAGNSSIPNIEVKTTMDGMTKEKLERIFVVVTRERKFNKLGDSWEVNNALTVDYYGVESTNFTRFFHVKNILYRAPKDLYIVSYSTHDSNRVEIALRGNYHGAIPK